MAAVSKVERYKLSYFDNNYTTHQYDGYLLGFGYYAEAGEADDKTTTKIVQHLQDGLDRLVQRFPSLHCRVKTFHDRMSLQEQGEGTPFSKLTLRVKKYNSTEHPGYIEMKKAGFPSSLLRLREMVPLLRPANGFRYSRVFDVQVNFLEGGLILGISLLNCVADRVRASVVIQTFADCCNPFSLHENVKKTQPVHDIDWNLPRAYDNLVSLIKECPEYELLPSHKINRVHCPLSFGKRISNMFVVPCIFRINAARLSKLKTATNAGNPDSPPFSDDEVFSAFIWAHATKAKNLLASILGYQQTVKMFFPIDVRNRLSPPIPKDYLGTATLQVFAEVSLCHLNDVCSEDTETSHTALAKVTNAIRVAKDQVDDAFIRRRLRLARALTKTRQLIYSVRSSDNSAFFYENLVGSRMGLGGRWGLPAGNSWGPEVVRMVQPYLRVGSCQILPSASQGYNGLVEVQLCLYTDEMQRMLEDTTWMKEVDSVLDKPEDWSRLKRDNRQHERSQHSDEA